MLWSEKLCLEETNPSLRRFKFKNICFCPKYESIIQLSSHIIIHQHISLARSNSLKINISRFWIYFLKTSSFSLKTLIDGLELCGLLIVMLSSDGTHSLQRIHWWVSDVMLHCSKSVHLKKQTHLHFGWPAGECMFISVWIIPLRL